MKLFCRAKKTKNIKILRDVIYPASNEIFVEFVMLYLLIQDDFVDKYDITIYNNIRMKSTVSFEYQ